MRLDLVYGCVIITHAQILYKCNFDTETIGTSCLLTEGSFGMLVTEGIGNAGNQQPAAPLSDVTSSRKNKYFSPLI
jgi:hypothetical protein